MCSHDSFPLLRLRVVADGDPGAIARVVERFQNLNIIPRRLSAKFSSNDLLHIEVDVCGVPDEHAGAGRRQDPPGTLHCECVLVSIGLSLAPE
jgi:hypothetical protein